MKRFMQWLREQAEYEKEHPRKDSLISYVNGMVTKKVRMRRGGDRQWDVCESDWGRWVGGEEQMRVADGRV